MNLDILAALRAGAVTASAEATRALAASFADVLPPDAILALHGDLGAGKTTFVQGLAQGFGVAGPVASPTFAIFNVHRGERRTLVHLDAYRLERPEQLEPLMLEDFLVPPYCLAAEWPERIAPALPERAWHLDLERREDGRHAIRLRR